MQLIEKADALKITKRLIDWGHLNYQDYPWRKVNDPWLGLLAEVLLQRTNAAHVARKWPEIVDRYPTPTSVLSATDQELQSIDAKFGLDRRSRTFLELASYIDERGHYPTDCNELKKIYGIGHYTAAAFLSLHMKTRAVLMDSNIARWLSRLFGIEKPKDLRKMSSLWTLADHLTPEKGFRDYNYSLLDFTITICKPRRPTCQSCIFSSGCKYFSQL